MGDGRLLTLTTQCPFGKDPEEPQQPPATCVHADPATPSWGLASPEPHTQKQPPSPNA